LAAHRLDRSRQKSPLVFSKSLQAS
jgi:hypothetical protein